MANPLEPRGPLPARVYWTRRLLVLGLALVLVVAIAQALAGGSDATSRDGGEAARMSAGEVQPTTPAETTPAVAPRKRPVRQREPRLARPDGPCEEGDILAIPRVGRAEAGRDVAITIRLRTRTSEACTWAVSSDTLALTITSGDDEIWTSRECPRAVPTEDVVVRRAGATPVEVVWNARRSDEDCSQFTEWAMMGYYHVEAAALAGEPSDVQFELVRPVSETVTTTVTPRSGPRSRAERPGPRKKKDESTSHRAGDDGGGNSDG